MNDFHHTLREIREGGSALRNTLRGRLVQKNGTVSLRGAEEVKDRLPAAKRIHIIGCGTAWHAALVGEYLLRELAGVSVVAETAAEFRYRNHALTKDDVVIAVSQSGETADTLEAIRESKRKGALAFGVINTVNSSIAREVDAGIYTHAGTETAILSTKAFISQAAVFVMLGLFLGRRKGLSLSRGREITKELAKLPEKIERTLRNENSIKKLAKKYARFSNFFLVGRKYGYPMALEGALKLKEGAYVHAEGLSAGELRHGPFALLDKRMPTIAFVPEDSVREKMLATIKDIRSKKFSVFAIATERDVDVERIADDTIFVPATIELLYPILLAVPLQLFTYFTARIKKINPDTPRNLTKSVSVQ